MTSARKKIGFLMLIGSVLCVTSGAEADEFVCWKPTGSDATSANAGYRDERIGTAARARLGKLKPVGDDDLTKASYKFMGQLRFRKKGDGLVGTAGFIAPNLLITAAHNLLSADNGKATSMTFHRAHTPKKEGDEYIVTVGAYLKRWEETYRQKDGDDAFDYAILKISKDYGGGYLGTNATALPITAEPKTKFTILAYSNALDDPDQEQLFSQDSILEAESKRIYTSLPTEPDQGGSFKTRASGGAWLTAASEVFSVEASGIGDKNFGPVLDAKLSGMVEYVNRDCK